MERPILMSSPMVRAILDGRKSQTRRLVNPQPERAPMPCHYVRSGWAQSSAPNEYGAVGCMCSASVIQRYCDVGDVLWVRETWADLRGMGFDAPFAYRADSLRRGTDQEDCDGKRCRLDFGVNWKPSIFMVREASRLSLLVTDVRVQRLQEISADDACAEGIDDHDDAPERIYERLWDTINAKRAPWASNPWVWAITFERIAAVAALAEAQDAH